MLTDYVITRKKNRWEIVMTVLELLVAVVIIFSVVTMLTGANAEEEETIRFRVLAHSNMPADQQLKQEILAEVQPMIEQAAAVSMTKEELEINLRNLEESIRKSAQGLAEGQTISFERKHALFPAKREGLYIYPQAVYDAYILTIGSGRGDNWWCALFPKVCFPDQEEEEEEVVFFVWEWIKEKFL